MADWIRMSSHNNISSSVEILAAPKGSERIYIDINLSGLYSQTLWTLSQPLHPGDANIRVQGISYLWLYYHSPVGAFCQTLHRRYSRAFPVAGPRIWNALPQETSAQSLSLFRQRLKSHLFRQSYPDLVF